jgi:hypothetical protein
MFANVMYMCENFTLPDTKDEWYDLDNIKKYKLHLAYEALVYDLFKDKSNLIYNTKSSFDKLIEVKDDCIEWGINDRRHSEKNLIDTFFTVLPTNTTDEKLLLLHNQSFYLKEGAKNYDVKIYYDNILFDSITIHPYVYNIITIIGDVKEVKIVIDGYGEKIIKCDHTINYNGIYFYKNY